MNTIFKRFISCLLVICLLFNVSGVTAFASNDDSEPFEITETEVYDEDTPEETMSPEETGSPADEDPALDEEIPDETEPGTDAGEEIIDETEPDTDVEDESAELGQITEGTELLSYDVKYEDLEYEILDLREECAKQFRLSDGDIALMTYETDIHYQDENGIWQEIDNTLIPERALGKGDVDGYRTTAGKTAFKFSHEVYSDYLVRLRQKDYEIKFKLTDAQKGKINLEAPVKTSSDDFAAKVEVPKAVSGVFYRDILPGTDLEYIAYGSSLKENIIVREPQDDYVYRFNLELENISITENKNGTLSFCVKDSDVVLYTIPHMFMTDSEGYQSDAVEYWFDANENQLIIKADPEWMNSAAFPVVIDPTLIASSSSTGSEARIVQNQYVCSNHPTTSHADFGSGFLGYDSYTDHTYRMFVQFKTLPTIPKDSIIVGANMYYCQTNSFSYVSMSKLVVGAYKVTENWTWGETLNWDTQPAFSSTALDYEVLSSSTSGGYVHWDITPLIKEHYEDKDNATNVTTSFALIGVDESTYSDYNCAKAQIVQENSQGYFSPAQPILQIKYRNNRGIEGQYSYQTQNGGKAGVGYVGDYSKELTLVKPIFSTNNAAMPFTISAIYNSAIGDSYFTSSASIHTKNYTNMKIGLGWKLNIQQTLVPITISGVNYLIYCDEDGTEHYFVQTSDDTAKYEDEDGLGLSVHKDSSAKYTMSNEQGEKWIFYNGYISEIKDRNGNTIYFYYNEATSRTGNEWRATTGTTNRITQIVRRNNGTSTDVTIATLDYAGTNYLHTITDQYNRQYTLYYTTAATNSSGAVTSKNLIKIENPDNSYAEYQYYLASENSLNRLARTLDSETKLGLRYTYSIKNYFSKLNEFGEILWNSDNSSYTQGRRVSITNSTLQQVRYQDYGLDCSKDTLDDIKTYCAFDNAGRTVSTVSGDSTLTTIYGASASIYTASSGGKTANKLLSGTAIGTNSVNLLKNGGAEASASSATNWYNSRKTLDADKVTTTVSSSAARSGNRGFAITIDSTARPDSNNDLAGRFYAKVNLTAGKTYTFSGYYKNTDSSGFSDKSQVYLGAYLSSTGTRVATSTVLTTATSANIENGWVRLSVTITPSETAQYNLAAWVYHVTGTTYFDDFQLEEGSAPSNYNYLTNGDVEWSDGWTFSTGASRDSGTIHGNAIKITGKPTENRYASITVPLNTSSNNTFVLSGWAEGNSVPQLGTDDRTFGIEVILSYADTSTTETHTLSFNSISSLQYGSINVVPKRSNKTLTQAVIRCVYGHNMNSAIFDCISFVKEPVSCFSYDSDGNLVAANQNGAENMSFTYDAGNLISESGTGSGTFTYTYDSKHNLETAVNDGVNMALTYNMKGGVLTSTVSGTDETRTIKSFAGYNDDGSFMNKQTSTTGAITTYTQDSYGRVGSVTDANGNIVTNTYDENNDRITQISLANGTSVSYSYSNGYISSITRNAQLPTDESITQTFTLTHNAYGDVTKVKVGTRTLATYTYMAKNGPMQSMTYPSGYKVSYTYDSLGRIIAESHDDTPVYQYVYSSNGNLARKEELDSNGKVIKQTCYEYDSLGRLIRSSEDRANGSKLYRAITTEHIYDTNNRLTKQSWVLADGTSRTEQFTYNANDGMISGFRSITGRNVTLTYDGLKRLCTRSDGVSTQTYTYRNINSTRTTTQVSNLSWTDITEPISFSYDYDPLGNILEVTENGTSTQYTYDAQNQLTSVTDGSGTTTYTYDTAGNIRSITKGNTTKSFAYTNSQWNDLLTSVDGHTISYDANGNPTSYYNGTSWVFTWVEGRRLESASTGSTSLTFAYDSTGLRTSKTAGSVTYNYEYLGNKLVEMTWSTGSDDKKMEFCYDELGRPYSCVYNGSAYYYILNLQGDVVRIVNYNGETRVNYTYDAWGRVLSTTGSLANSLGKYNPLRYRGYVYDTELRMYYLQSRYFDPSNCRFINADDASLLGTGGSVTSYNLFAYCDNNPTNKYDPYGKLGWLASGIIGGVLGAVTAAIAGGDIVDIAIGAATGFISGAASDACAATASAVAAYGAAVDAAKNDASVGGVLLAAVVAGATTYATTRFGGYLKSLGKCAEVLGNVVFGMGASLVNAAVCSGTAGSNSPDNPSAGFSPNPNKRPINTNILID